MNNQFEQLSDIFKNKQRGPKPPAYEWQDLALRVIKELGVPNFKRSSVFKICKDNPKIYVERCLNETKELCDSGQRWKYFFKLISGTKKEESESIKKS